MLECKRRRVVPKFISDSINVRRILGEGDSRVTNIQERYGLEVLRNVIGKELNERRHLRSEVLRNQQQMTRYNKEHNLFVKQVKAEVLTNERSVSSTRLERKISQLSKKKEMLKNTTVGESKLHNGQSAGKRVVCIECDLTEAEKDLLGKGPKFVPTRGKLTRSELRSIESEIETTTCFRRWKTVLQVSLIVLLVKQETLVHTQKVMRRVCRHES